MLHKTVAWHQALSKSAKIVAWSVVGAAGLIGVGAANGGSTPPANIADTTTSINHPVADKIETEDITQTTPIPFDKKTFEDGSLAKGTTKVTTSGANGIKTSIFTVIYTNGTETKRSLKNETVTLEPTSEITTVGTYVVPAPTVAATPATQASNCDPNYSPCISNVAYDLDCKDVGMRVRVTGQDHHRLDGNGDGIGCESY